MTTNPFEPPSEATPSQPPAPAPAPAYGHVPYGQVPYGQAPYGQVPYGQVPYGYSPYGAPVAVMRNGLGVAALVLGIVGAVTGATILLCVIAFPTGVLAIIFGAIGRGRAKRGEASNKTMSTWGLWLGVVAVLLSIVGVFVYIHIIRDHDACVRRAVTQEQADNC